MFASVPSSAYFSSNIFRILTYFLASPLLFGCLELDVMTVKFHSVANCSNSADEKGTLSATRVSGIPCPENIIFIFIFIMTHLAVFD